MKAEELAGAGPATAPAAPAGEAKAASRCARCQGYSQHHSLEMCIFILSKRLRESERERAIADGTVAWLRRRLGEPDEE